MSGFDFADRLELLVEGELSEDQRREVLMECEDNPIHWKSLAIAFLEQQKLKDGMRHAHQPSLQQQHKSEPTLRRHSVPWQTSLALAACVVIAFALGWQSNQSVPGDDALAIESIETSDSLVNADVNADPIEGNQSPTEGANGNDEGIVGYVRWQGNGGTVRLSPVFVGQVDDQWLKEHPPQIDRKVQQVMSRAGWQVEPARKFVSVNLTSGDQFTIPMDDVEYRYVGRQVY